MFRSLFTKYITVFMLIIIISFILQISIIATLIGGYSDSSKQESLSRAADAVASYVQDAMSKVRFRTLKQYVNSYRTTINRNVYMMLKYSGDMSIIIVDSDGTVLFSTGENVPVIPGEDDENIPYFVVSNEIMDMVYQGEYSFVSTEEEGIFANVTYVYSRPIYYSEKNIKGAVFTCSSDSNTDDLLDSLINTSTMASLWVMLASLIAVYFISERVISPIKDMSIAAKSFAAGNFDIRIPVNGRDEVAELASAFNNMANSLSNLEEMRSTFIANISHDLRTPMTTISGFVDSILDGAIPPDKYEHYLSIISTEVKRLSRLVNSLLDLTKIQAGERKFNRIVFDICELSRQILISMEKRIDEKKLDVEFICSEENIFVNADRDSIYQILYNICDNAIKFSYPNGKYKVSIASLGKKVHVSVYNEGEGIPAADIPYVFDRFYKSDKSRGLDKTGIGLGLFIAKTIVESHGETINVKSDYGKYCEFHFTLEPAKAK